MTSGGRKLIPLSKCMIVVFGVIAYSFIGLVHAQDIFVRKNGTDKIIVFAHGVMGDARATFTNDRTKAFWPQLIADDKDMDSFDILTINYDAGISSGMSIEQISTVVGTRLRDRGILDNYNEIYFVTHSMGGLVVKRMIIDLWQARSPALQQQISGVIFISTPAKGANAANYLGIMARLVGMRPLVDLRTYDVNSYLQILENQWKDYFDKGRTNGVPKVFAAYETRPTYGYTVVPQLYAETPQDGRAYPVSADHLSIVKPADRNDPIYEWVKSRILEASKAHATVPFKQWGPGDHGWVTLDQLIDQFSAPTAERDGMNIRILGDPSVLSTVGRLSVTGSYNAATWADLFDRISERNNCIHQWASLSRREVTLSSLDTPKRCPSGATACPNVGCP